MTGGISEKCSLFYFTNKEKGQLDIRKLLWKILLPKYFGKKYWIIPRVKR